MEGRPRRKAAEVASMLVQPNLAKKARVEMQMAALTNDAAKTLLTLSENPVVFDRYEGVEGDAAKYVKYLKDKLNTKSPAVVVATRAFGPKVVADFIAKRKAVRYMFAPPDNTAQCVRAGLKNPPDTTDTCWLCGFGLYKNGTPVDTIACEHILPVIQAVIFADIALTKTPSTSTPELVKAEYAWAHAVCNGPKSSSVFIKEVQDESGHIIRWDVDMDKIVSVLNTAVAQIKKKKIDSGTLSTQTQIDEWIKRQSQSIADRLLPILNRINQGEDTVRMNVLLGVTKLLDPERWSSTTPLDKKAYAKYADQVIERAAETSLSQVGRSRRQTKRKRRMTFKKRK